MEKTGLLEILSEWCKYSQTHSKKKAVRVFKKRDNQVKLKCELGQMKTTTNAERRLKPPLWRLCPFPVGMSLKVNKVTGELPPS